MTPADGKISAKTKQPKGSKKVTLGDVGATPEEVEQANASIEAATGDMKQKLLKSKMNCMRQWILANPQEVTDSNAVLASRGSQRKAYLTAFLVLQMRQHHPPSSQYATSSRMTRTRRSESPGHEDTPAGRSYMVATRCGQHSHQPTCFPDSSRQRQSHRGHRHTYLG